MTETVPYKGRVVVANCHRLHPTDCIPVGWLFVFALVSAFPFAAVVCIPQISNPSGDTVVGEVVPAPAAPSPVHVQMLDCDVSCETTSVGIPGEADATHVFQSEMYLQIQA